MTNDSLSMIVTPTSVRIYGSTRAKRNYYHHTPTFCVRSFVGRTDGNLQGNLNHANFVGEPGTPHVLSVALSSLGPRLLSYCLQDFSEKHIPKLAVANGRSVRRSRRLGIFVRKSSGWRDACITGFTHNTVSTVTPIIVVYHFVFGPTYPKVLPR
jgi:hypothetical protein